MSAPEGISKFVLIGEAKEDGRKIYQGLRPIDGARHTFYDRNKQPAAVFLFMQFEEQLYACSKDTPLGREASYHELSVHGCKLVKTSNQAYSIRFQYSQAPPITFSFDDAVGVFEAVLPKEGTNQLVKITQALNDEMKEKMRKTFNKLGDLLLRSKGENKEAIAEAFNELGDEVLAVTNLEKLQNWFKMLATLFTATTKASS